MSKVSGRIERIRDILVKPVVLGQRRQVADLDAGRQECPPDPHNGFLTMRAPTRDAPTRAMGLG